MLELLILLNVCAPFDWSDCTYTIQISNTAHDQQGSYDPQTKTITLRPHHFMFKDCWGNTVWHHEWLHAEFGSWHTGNKLCHMRTGFWHVQDHFLK